jgi:DNA-binding NtrC family response regulator
MMPNPSVLIGLRGNAPQDLDVRDRLTGWVRHLGYEPAVADDGPTALAWAQERPFVASLLDCGVEAERGIQVWRSVHPVLGRRLVLMVREARRDVWFEALCRGVGAVLPLPARERMVKAALHAATGDEIPPCTGARYV